VVRSALAEIEGYRAVQLGEFPNIAVAADLVADLRLLLAELIENATNFSPPGTPVEVTAVVEHDCYLAVVDHGVGLSTVRIDEENRRLVERERLDVAPTRVLGLFVVGRLARRHGLGVRLDPSEGRGVTATVRIPARLLAPGPGGPIGAPVPSGPSRPAPALGVIPPTAIEAIRAAEKTGPFPWLTEPGPMAIEAGPARDVDEAWPGGLPGPEPSPAAKPAPSAAAMPPTPATPPPAWPPTPPAQPTSTPPGPAPLPRRSVSTPDPAFSADPHATVIEQSQQPPAARAESTRSGLSRRVPGTHLADAVVAGMEPPSSHRARRDPEAERDALNDYLSGLTRGTVDQASDPATDRDPGRAMDPSSEEDGSDQELESRPTLAERHS
jgi:hypothetical protein